MTSGMLSSNVSHFLSLKLLPGGSLSCLPALGRARRGTHRDPFQEAQVPTVPLQVGRWKQPAVEAPWRCPLLLLLLSPGGPVRS